MVPQELPGQSRDCIKALDLRRFKLAIWEQPELQARSYLVGQPGYARDDRAIYQLHEANLELALNDEKRVAVIEANLNELKSLEAEAKGRRDSGTLSESDYLLTVISRLGGEIELHKAKRG